MKDTILILYTTRYRGGGAEMDRAARQMAREKATEFPNAEVVCRAVESKAEFLAAIAESEAIHELHFIGHSGLYGPMFGTTAQPDQMSRAEWVATSIPFTPGGEAFFHCCRSARWFAPYFARRYGVPTRGHRLYTTFSRNPNHYRKSLPEGEVWVVSVPGYKAGGVLGAVRKRLGQCPTIPMERFEPAPAEDGSYDGVAELYDQVFEDFRVRADEWRWVTRNLPPEPRLLDVGCGNGALLLALAPTLTEGLGVDASARMLEAARHGARGEPNLRFEQIEGPHLPVPDGSVDAVVCMLSWRYLDWDPMAAEIHRVLRPGGRLLVADMVHSPFRLAQVPRALWDKAATLAREARKPQFRRALRRMVEDPRWATMLRHNPMRAQHEYRWYFPSRFPGCTVEVINRGLRSEILGFVWEKPG